jgi:hypothetical protein
LPPPGGNILFMPALRLIPDPEDIKDLKDIRDAFPFWGGA